MKNILYFYTSFTYFFFLFPVVGQETSGDKTAIFAPVHSARPKLYQYLKSDNPEKPDILLEVNYLPPKGMTQEEYQKSLVQRELRNVVRGVDKIIKPQGELKKKLTPPVYCNAQVDKHDFSSTDHTTYLGSQQVGAFTAHLLKMPLNTKSRPERSITLLMNTGNTHILDTTLDNGEKSRHYHFDGVIEKNTLVFNNPLSEKDEITFKLNFFSVTGKGQINPVQWLVGDQFIEDFHSNVLGIDDPFNRQELGMNEVHYSATDHNGNQLNADGGKIYLEPAEVAYTHYFSLFENDNTNFSANSSVALGIPYNSYSLQQNISGGVSSTINLTQKISDHFSVSTSAKGSVTNNALVKMKDDAYQFTDDNTYEVQGLLGLNYTSKKDRISLYTSINKSSAPTRDYPEIDLDRVTLAERLSYQAATEDNEYLEVGVSYSRQLKNKKVVTIEFSIREDVQLSPHTKYDNVTTGANNEDFGTFLGISYKY